MNEKEYIIYTDGSSKPNPGIGGYAAVITDQNGTETIVKGGKRNTNNYEMELTAVLMALKSIKEPGKLHFVCDLEDTVKAFNEWLPGWVARGWKKADRKPVKHKEKWEDMLKEIERASIGEPTFTHVHSHVGIAPNEEVDKLAAEARGRLENDDALDEYEEVVRKAVRQAEWVREAADMTYEDVASEWGFDDEDGEAQEPD